MQPKRHLAHPHVWRERPWADISALHHDLAERHPALSHMSRITDSVLAEGAAERLSALTSHYDLLVTPRPVPAAPPIEYVHVYMDLDPRTGDVVIEHVTASGRNDKVARPPADAVPLFWRFMIEKFGVSNG